MKKTIALILTFALALSFSVTAFAEDVTEKDGNGQRATTISTSIAPTYTVTIPENLEVKFNQTSTDFGIVKLNAAQLDPGYAVKVVLYASGTLKNQANASKTPIVYTVNDANGKEFTSAAYTATDEKTSLTVDITQEAWDTAYAGEYSDIVTFIISYDVIS